MQGKEDWDNNLRPKYSRNKDPKNDNRIKLIDLSAK